MARAWETVDSVQTPDGELTLLRRGARDFLITQGSRVLMNSQANRSELALAERACRPLARRPAPRVLIGGLGMGCTLRAALAMLPIQARVTVVELHATVVSWCAGPLAEVNQQALSDPRVELVIDDVAAQIRQHSARLGSPPFDAIVLDLFEGPHAATDPVGDPFYGQPALERTWRVLAPGGLFAVWSEDPDSRFEERLRQAGFEVKRQRPGRGGRRHAVYLGRKGDVP